MAGWSSYESPQMRRLKHDLAGMEGLRAESSVLAFRASGTPPQRYLIEFKGRSLARERGKVVFRDHHEVEIKLGASYPRTMPEIRWLSPIYHPNISEIGLVCLGGYGTHWVPSLHLDDLCTMLWDMARYHNYDIRSPYNREAALWAANQSSFRFPTDDRPLRDLRAKLGRIDPDSDGVIELVPEPEKPTTVIPPPPPPRRPEVDPEGGICILDLEVDLRRAGAPPRRPPAQEEIVFLE